MKILGVDPALSITGYGVIYAENNKLSLLEAGIISTFPKEILTRRLEKIYCGVIKLISDTCPDVLVLEKIYTHYRHPTTAYLLGEARGVICLACAEKNVPLVEYGATRVKKAIVGRGLASKQQVQRMVASVLKLNSVPKYTDVTDALALAIAHSYIMRSKI
ncbi:MAG: crossover junction endodeoxyribonuclease RuvC [Candidatus Omnitrophica bacterium]|nr:crossover junction endodeoxyribonuclease RuvC [Candidatus Omnitrophota bacterium]